MTKQELVSDIAKATGYTKKIVTVIVDAFSAKIPVILSTWDPKTNEPTAGDCRIWDVPGL